jgi:hypothetical protein
VSVLRAAGPELIAVSGRVASAGTSIVQSYAAGGSSSRANLFVDWTSKLWLSTARSVKVTGDSHGVNSAPSSEQVWVTPGWSDENVKVALTLVVVVGAAGTSAVIVVTAGPTTFQVNSAGVASTFRLGSVARTSTLCVPGSSPENSAKLSGGDAQLVYSGTPTGSSAHSNVTPGSLLEKVNSDGSSALTSGSGADWIVVSGAVSSSTVHSQTAGRASASMCAFSATTSKVCGPAALPVARARSASV